MDRKGNSRSFIETLEHSTTMSDTHAAKKPKTTSTGPPLYSGLDLAKLSVDATLLWAPTRGDLPRSSTIE